MQRRHGAHYETEYLLVYEISETSAESKVRKHLAKSGDITRESFHLECATI